MENNEQEPIVEQINYLNDAQLDTFIAGCLTRVSDLAKIRDLAIDIRVGRVLRTTRLYLSPIVVRDGQ